MFKRRNPESPWLLRPGDLPPPEIIAREPRLAGLEDNPVFRLILWRRRVAPFSSMLPGTLAGWLPLFFPVSYLLARYLFPGSFFGVLVMFAVVVLGYVVRFGSRIGRAAAAGVFFGVPDQFLHDLHRAAYTAEEIALGIWGAQVVAGRRGLIQRVLAVNVMIATTGVLAMLSRMAGLAAMLMFIGMVAFRISLMRHGPETALFTAVNIITRNRPDLRADTSGADSLTVIGFVMLFAVAPFAILVLATQISPPPPAWGRLLTFGVYPFVAAVLGLVWGLLSRKALRSDLEIHYRFLRGLIHSLLVRLEESAGREG